jgi:DNA replication protein DnaC
VRRLHASVAVESSAELVAAAKPDGDRKVNQRAVRADLLVLDDLGQERPTEFARETVFEVIAARYDAEAPMIVTSNLGDAQLRDAYGEALVSRLYESTELVTVTASDYRAEIARERGAA